MDCRTARKVLFRQEGVTEQAREAVKHFASCKKCQASGNESAYVSLIEQGLKVRDPSAINCTAYRLLSQEGNAFPTQNLEAHLEHCSDCRDWDETR